MTISPTMIKLGITTPAIHLDLNAPVAFQLADALPSDLGFKQQLLGSRSDADRTIRLRDFYNEMLPKLHNVAGDAPTGPIM